MTKQWRPEGWEDKKLMRSWGKLTLEGEYEMGADAILEALEPLIMKIAPNSKLVDILYSKEVKG